MANNPTDPFEKQLDRIGNALEQDLLASVEPERHVERLDWLARTLTSEGSYMLMPPSGNSVSFDRDDFKTAAPKPYLRSISKITGEHRYRNALSESYPLGQVILQYAELVQGLERVDRGDVDPGEILGRYVARSVQRRSRGGDVLSAAEFRPDTRQPYELVEQILAHPSLASSVAAALPDRSEAKSIVNRLGEVELTTPLWEHQRRGLVNWLANEGNAYVNMATATGKTVLGLAAVAYASDSGSLHPADQEFVEEWCAENLAGSRPPDVGSNRASDVLIVTTDQLLGVQWGRLFQEHCQTPPEFTKVVDQTISLPWGDIDIRAANGLDGVSPSDYRIAVFDEVHNYSSGSGWGGPLIEFVDSDCPVIALTGSVNEEIERRFRNADRPFPEAFRYTHEEALDEGVIPDFEWTLRFTPVDPDRSSTLGSMQATATAFDLVRWEAGELRLDTDAEAFNKLTPAQRRDLRGTYGSETALANALRDAGTDGVAPDRYDRLAAGLAKRQTDWWNLRNDLEWVVDTMVTRMNRGSPVLVLTRSYSEADAIYSALRERTRDGRVVKLESGDDASTQDDQITSFDAIDTDKKALIGPGDRIGTGNDIQTVEVGINLGRPGSGMSASLIQRLGRLLRRAGEKESVEFYHLLGVPPADAVIPPDGEDFVRNAAGFVSSTLAPDSDETGGRMMKVPAIRVDEAIRDGVRALERTGSTALRAQEEELDPFEAAYVEAIREDSFAAEEEADPTTVERAWYKELLDGVEAPTPGPEQSLDAPGRGSEQPADEDTNATREADREGTTTVTVTVETVSGNPVVGGTVSLATDTGGHYGVTNGLGMVRFEGIQEPEAVLGIWHPEYEPAVSEPDLTGCGGSRMIDLTIEARTDV